nr:aliphatic sulfonate ABC transporter substrate-binding protein [Streptomyces anulatus]
MTRQRGVRTGPTRGKPPVPAPRSTVRRSIAAVAALPLLALAATACGYGSEAKDDDAKKANVSAGGKKLSTDTVKIGYFPNLTHATALVGIQEGTIQKELGGTRVESTTFNAGPSEIEALNAGSIDIGFIGPSPSINGFSKSQGKGLRIISGSASGGVKLVVNPDRIKTLDDLKGKKIATPQLGNTQDVAFLNWISEKGWKVDAQSGKGDVSVVRSDNKVTPDAYKSGDLDGAWVPEPTASKLVSEGAKVLLDETDLWPDKKFVITNIIVSQKFLDEHPDVVKAVLKGSVATNKWINANPDEAKASANKALENLSGKPLPEEILDPAWESIEITDDPLAQTLKTQAGYSVKSGLLKEPNLQGIYDLGPLNKILKAEGRPEVADAGLGVK